MSPRRPGPATDHEAATRPAETGPTITATLADGPLEGKSIEAEVVEEHLPAASGRSVGERLGRVAAEQGMLLMLCDQCALERCLAEGEIGAAVPTGTVAGVRVGCFPDLYAALAGDPPDHVITL